MRLLLSILALASISSASLARDLVTTDGKTYPNVQIVQITPLGLNFLCDGKSGWVDFKDLPADVQNEFGYDAAKSQAFEKKLADNNGSDLVSGSGYDSMGMPDEAQALPQGQQPPPGSTVVDMDSDGDEPAINIACGGPSCCSNYYVNWNGRYYPYYYWHHWWWNHHWVYQNGRYYPWSYYNHHGVWHNGHYYPYHHGNLQGSEAWRKADAERDRHMEAHRSMGGQEAFRSLGGRSGGHSGGGHSGGGGHR